MLPEQITEEFYKAISERAVHNKLGMARAILSQWNTKQRIPPLGTMLEVLLKLNRIKITLNEPG